MGHSWLYIPFGKKREGKNPSPAMLGLTNTAGRLRIFESRFQANSNMQEGWGIRILQELMPGNSLDALWFRDFK